jgi:VIT1/CCC1 family predicted Fe2+/Mn2+ transporter
MGTKTVDETAGRTDQDKVDEVAKSEATENTAVDGDATAVDEPAVDETDAGAYAGAAGKDGPTGVGQGAGAVVSAGLGIVSLTGSWVGTVASARESLFGRLETTQSSDVQTMLQKGYGDAWQATALWGGVFALVALIVGVVVLVRPAFGAPGKPQAAWIKSVSWAGVALGVIGLILAVLKYTDVMMAVPSAG